MMARVTTDSHILSVFHSILPPIIRESSSGLLLVNEEGIASIYFNLKQKHIESTEKSEGKTNTSTEKPKDLEDYDKGITTRAKTTLKEIDTNEIN